MSAANQFPIWRRFRDRSALQHAVEDFAYVLRLAPIVTKGKLVEVVLKLLGANGSLMRS